jgi:glucoamylase
LAPALIHWSADDWKTVENTASHLAALGMHIAELPTQALAEGSYVRFTFYWPEAHRWEGTDFVVGVASLQRV